MRVLQFGRTFLRFELGQFFGSFALSRERELLRTMIKRNDGGPSDNDKSRIEVTEKKVDR